MLICLYHGEHTTPRTRTTGRHLKCRPETGTPRITDRELVIRDLNQVELKGRAVEG